MPNNKDAGYLEHFLISLIKKEDEMWHLTNQVVNDFVEKEKHRFPKVRLGKAMLHTWLAWQKEPGKPFGQAIDENYFDAKSETVQPFLDWFGATFQLGK
jgi:hypothetical protein